MSLYVISDLHNLSKNRQQQCGILRPNGYIHNTTPAHRLREHGGRGGGKTVRAQGSRSLL